MKKLSIKALPLETVYKIAITKLEPNTGQFGGFTAHCVNKNKQQFTYNVTQRNLDKMQERGVNIDVLPVALGIQHAQFTPKGTTTTADVANYYPKGDIIYNNGIDEVPLSESPQDKKYTPIKKDNVDWDKINEEKLESMKRARAVNKGIDLIAVTKNADDKVTVEEIIVMTKLVYEADTQFNHMLDNRTGEPETPMTEEKFNEETKDSYKKEAKDVVKPKEVINKEANISVEDIPF